MPRNLIGLAGDFLDRQRRAAAGIAVELGEDEAVDLEAPVELGGGLHRVLADHRVGDEEDVVGLDVALIDSSSGISALVDRRGGRRCR